MDAFLLRVRYSKPTSFRKVRRLLISFKISFAIKAFFSLNFRFSRNSKWLSTERLVNSEIFLSPTVILKTSFFNLVPMQSGHAFSITYFCIFSRISSDEEFTNLLSKLGMTPSKGALYSFFSSVNLLSNEKVSISDVPYNNFSWNHVGKS